MDLKWMLDEFNKIKEDFRTNGRDFISAFY